MLSRFLSGGTLCAVAMSLILSSVAATSAPPVAHSILHPLSFILQPLRSSLPHAQVNAVYDVPYRLSEISHILVRAKINGRGPFTFIMDSGAPAIYLAKPVAARCGVTANQDGWSVLDRMEIEGGLPLEKMPARVEEPAQLSGMNALGLSSDHIDGVLGYNLLSLFRIQLDLTRSKMIWTRTVETPVAPESETSAVSQASETPSFKRALKGVKEMNALIQTTGALFAQPHAPVSVPRGFLGLALADSAEGPRVERALPGGPAARAGLTAGDLVLKLVPASKEPVTVKDAAAIVLAAGDVRAGERVLFVLQRGPKRLKIAVTAGKEGF